MDPNPAPMGPLGLDLMLSRVVFGGGWEGKNQSQGPLDGGRSLFPGNPTYSKFHGMPIAS